ncbi:MAG TPA: Ig-like domain repeat protein, partial [Solirubrobacterales bacterium]
MLNNLSLNTATINGAVVTGGASNNRNGQDATEAELQEEATYVGIGWDFEKVWAWSPTLKRPVLRSVAAAEGGASVPTESATFQVGSEADLALMRTHPDANFELTADITMAHPWKPLAAFGGTLNGNGYTITGLETEGQTSKAFVLENSGTIKELGFIDPKSIYVVADPMVGTSYAEANRMAAVAVVNSGRIESVYTKGADIEGGWRNAPIAANNEGTVIDSYTVDSKIVSNYESGALVAWNSTNAVVKDSYVAGANVTDVTNNSGILGGYGWGVTNGKAATLYEGDVVYSGSLTGPSGANNGRIDGQEKGAPSFVGNLASTAATINGAPVAGGLATNKNGGDATPAELETEATYTGLGWDFTNVWEWSATLKRPVLRGVAEPIAPTKPVVSVAHSTLTYQVGAHPSGADLLTAAGATTTDGTLSIDTSAVNFAAAGEYTAEVGADNDGEDATQVPVTIKVVAVTTISVAESTVSLPASVAPITAAEVIAAAGAAANNGATVTADVSAVHSDEPGSYQATLAATDPFGFTVAPVTVTVEVVAAPTHTSLVASASSQVFGTPTPVALTAKVVGGDGSALAGTVGLFDGLEEIAAAPLEGGEASFTLSRALAVGDHALTAEFVPVGAADAGSGSDPVHVAVTELAKTPEGETETKTETTTNQGASVGSTSNSPAPSSPTPTPSTPAPTKPKSAKPSKEATKTSLKITKGKRPELAIKVTAASGKPDGQVKVYVDSQVVKTVTLKNGTAEVSLPLKKGTHKVKATFSGDSSLKPSTSPTLSVTLKG